MLEWKAHPAPQKYEHEETTQPMLIQKKRILKTTEEENKESRSHK